MRVYLYLLLFIATTYSNYICSFSPQAIHKALLEVDETGTEAAGATAIILTKGFRPSVTIKFNRPFIMLISDKATSTTLFMGKIVDPTKK